MTVSGSSRDQSNHPDGQKGDEYHLNDIENAIHSSLTAEMTHPAGAEDNDNITACSQSTQAPTVTEDHDDKDGTEADCPLLEQSDVIQVPDVTQIDPEEGEDEDDGVPYDRGWAWMVLLGLFVNFCLLAGYLKSSGVIFVALLRKFNAPVTHTALLFTFRAGIFSLSGMYVMNVLLGRFGARKLVIIGGICLSLSAILSSVANNLTLLICINSVLCAFGMAMLISPGEVLVGSYFRKRRSLALSIAKCGASVGNITLPPLVSYLLTEYGLMGTLLLCGGMFLHAIPAGMLLTPLSYFIKLRQRRNCLKEVSSCGELGLGIETLEPLKAKTNHNDLTVIEVVEVDSRSEKDLQRRVLLKQHSMDTSRSVIPGNYYRQTSETVTSKTARKEMEDVIGLAKSNPELRVLPASRQRTFSELKVNYRREDSQGPPPKSDLLSTISQSSMMKFLSTSSLDVLSMSLMSIKSTDAKQKGPDQEPSPQRISISKNPEDSCSQKQDTSGCCKTVWKSMLMCPKNYVMRLDFSLLKKPTFRLLLLYTTFSPIINISLDYLPALSGENGVTETQAALLLSIIGGLDLVGRISCGFIADLKIVRVSTLIIAAYTVMGITIQFVRFMDSFRHFVVFAVIQGLFGGAGNCLFAVLVIEFVGLQDMGKAIGFCQLVSGFSMSLVYPFLGYIRDITGSYAVAYHLIGCFTLVAAGLLSCETFIRRLEDRKLDKKQHKESEPPKNNS